MNVAQSSKSLFLAGEKRKTASGLSTVSRTIKNQIQNRL
jgi:hypothetical protein